MIVWLAQAGLPPTYPCDQRAKVEYATDDPKFGVRITVRMCGTNEEVTLSPSWVRGVELTPGVSVHFRGAPGRISSSYINGELES